MGFQNGLVQITVYDVGAAVALQSFVDVEDDGPAIAVMPTNQQRRCAGKRARMPEIFSTVTTSSANIPAKAVPDRCGRAVREGRRFQHQST